MPQCTKQVTGTYNKWEDSFAHRTAKNVFSGTLSGIAGCLVGHPFDTVKVRLQTQPVKNPLYRGPIDCVVKTLKWEGMGGFYKGVGMSLMIHIIKQYLSLILCFYLLNLIYYK